MVPLLLALAAPGALTGQMPKPPKAQPLVPLEKIVSAADYPVEAMRKGQEGSVRALITVDEQGAVTDCVIQQSSGFAALDAQTCRLIWTRAKFKPAVAQDGRRVRSEISRQFIWRLEEQLPPVEPWSAQQEILIQPNQQPTCRMVVVTVTIDKSGFVCPNEKTLADFAAWAVPGKVLKFFEEHQFALSLPMLNSRPGDRVLGSILVELEIEKGGAVRRCRLLDSQGKMPAGLDDPCATMPKRFTPPKKSDGADDIVKAYYLAGGYQRELQGN